MLHDQAVFYRDRVMRVSISVSEVPEETVQLTQGGPREDWGYTSDFRYGCEQQGLCSPAKGDPHEGHRFACKSIGREMVSLVPPVPRRDIKSRAVAKQSESFDRPFTKGRRGCAAPQFLGRSPDADWVSSLMKPGRGRNTQDVKRVPLFASFCAFMRGSSIKEKKKDKTV